MNYELSVLNVFGLVNEDYSSWHWFFAVDSAASLWEACNLAGCRLQMPLPQIWQLDPLMKQSKTIRTIYIVT